MTKLNLLSFYAGIVFLLGVSSSACEQPAHQETSLVNGAQVYSPEFVILPYSSALFPLFGSQASNTELDSDDLQLVNAMVGEKAYILSHTNGVDTAIADKIERKKFKRQYVAVNNALGEKEVWVNCFCENTHKDWKTEVIDSTYSKGCYFHFKINLKKYLTYDHRNGFK